ncbi:hypothetical protein HO133_004642 [Letharia lupina]|uniref:Uncharacterized protein n=1 Tax=Letharia lupina TaxID=560253 RepID=A0A8H6FKP2_9LECA|nr:uncharacterized protein HO133_004642 [Letharia lupina]KAF6230302.1 hypothetical protein HO133_004642 [Letharia lupina]
MSSTPSIKALLSIAVQLAESLSERIPNLGSLQRDCKQTAMNLRTWRTNLPSEMEFLLKPTGQLIWTTHELGKPPSLDTVSRTYEAEQKIKSASPSIKKFMDDLGVWQKPKKGHAPLAVLFDQTSRSDKVFTFTEKAVNGHMGACSNGLMGLTTRIDRARKRHVGLRLLAGKAP